MNVPRPVERIIRFILDQCMPPFLRDSRLLMWLPFRIAFGAKSGKFMDFKRDLARDHGGLLARIYTETGDVAIQDRGSDLSSFMADLVMSEVEGRSVLDAGCGKGHLAGMLCTGRDVTACDISISPDCQAKYPGISFRTADILELPFEDGQFDTVVCAHTLEHVWDIDRAISELRRVSSRRLIAVLPKERPYRFGFNLHIHFFLFEYQVLNAFRNRPDGALFRIEQKDGCWYYREDRHP